AMSRLTTNLPVFYRDLEIAENRNLARFTTSDTNIAFLTAGSDVPDEGGRIQLAYPVETETGLNATSLWTQVASLENERLHLNTDDATTPRFAVILDVHTNLAAVIPQRSADAPPEALDGVVLQGAVWKPAQPREFRAQSDLLRQARLAVSTIPTPEAKDALITALRETTWLTPHMAHLAGRFSTALEKPEEHTEHRSNK
ncbi:MAG: hypothetical protein O3A47_11035, partial [Chloroflexi bacterium]|nr:hypothetical protein [Chloroflexota bacterium]